jgi:hypothetical protein
MSSVTAADKPFIFSIGNLLLVAGSLLLLLLSWG